MQRPFKAGSALERRVARDDGVTPLQSSTLLSGFSPGNAVAYDMTGGRVNY